MKVQRLNGSRGKPLRYSPDPAERLFLCSNKNGNDFGKKYPNEPGIIAEYDEFYL